MACTPCYKEEHYPNTWNSWGGRDRRKQVPAGKEASNNWGEQLNDAFGSSKFSCSFKKGACFPPRKWPSKGENVDEHKQGIWIKWLPKPRKYFKVK